MILTGPFQLGIYYDSIVFDFKGRFPAKAPVSFH